MTLNLYTRANCQQKAFKRDFFLMNLFENNDNLCMEDTLSIMKGNFVLIQ